MRGNFLDLLTDAAHCIGVVDVGLLSAALYALLRSMRSASHLAWLVWLSVSGK
jgi:hypothetical protein